MALTWGHRRTLPQMLSDAARHKAALAIDAARLDQLDHDAAKRVVNREGLSEWDYIQAVLRTAQEIKLERMAK